MAVLRIVTGIVPDQPTANSNIYPRIVLERVIKHFNIRAKNKPIYGSEINPLHIEHIKKPTHTTNCLFLNESDMLSAEIETLDTEEGKALLGKIARSDGVVARPIMCVPTYVDVLKKQKKDGPLSITDVHSIVRVQVECNEKHAEDHQQNNHGG